MWLLVMKGNCCLSHLFAVMMVDYFTSMYCICWKRHLIWHEQCSKSHIRWANFWTGLCPPSGATTPFILICGYRTFSVVMPDEGPIPVWKVAHRIWLIGHCSCIVYLAVPIKYFCFMTDFIGFIRKFPVGADAPKGELVLHIIAGA
jgi:hypothetical protein